ncbi:uncharacterized protein BKA78DRAFT_296447 [Phyllosticta capitalensis]|uniref:uncharacterized protein n=1 Tax=Phyllosticta capitalensis TaxID=121624 RepID=UPI0031307AAC
MARLAWWCLLALVPLSSAYSDATCCEAAKKQSAFLHIFNSNVSDATCGQKYLDGLAPAGNLYINYTFCRDNCPGIGLSKADQPDEWAAPLVQFLLPSIIFSGQIPRTIQFEYLPPFDINPSKPHTRLLSYVVSFGWSLVVMACVFVDTLGWILVLTASASEMLVGALHEGLLDHRMVKFLRTEKSMKLLNLDARLDLLVTVVSGNLKKVGGINPKGEILQALRTYPLSEMKTKIRGLMNVQTPYGTAVGAPVVYFLGSFIYNILDIRNQPSDDNAAESIAFGVMWMLCVHIAIASGCLLAANSPAAASILTGLDENEFILRRAPTVASFIKGRSHFLGSPAAEAFGLTKMYENRYQPVALRSRGKNKEKWTKQTAPWLGHIQGFEKHMTITNWGFLFKIAVPTFILISLPPIAGGVVAYNTPPVGLGCRSLSFFCYAMCLVAQLILVSLKRITPNRGPLYWVLRIARWIVFALSAFVALGSTTMQIVGTYRNCLCYVHATEWLRLDTAYVDVASDTAAQRHSSKNWVEIGAVATAFMTVCCYIAWWYQRDIRDGFIAALDQLDSAEGASEERGRRRASSGASITSTSHLLQVPLHSSGSSTMSGSDLELGEVEVRKSEGFLQVPPVTHSRDSSRGRIEAQK